MSVYTFQRRPTGALTQRRARVRVTEIAWHYTAYVSHCDCDTLNTILKHTGEPLTLNARPPALLMNDGANFISGCNRWKSYHVCKPICHHFSYAHKPAVNYG